ncbi:MAG: sugar phosphate isomerase/epimerase [Ignavibacteriales bacterium]|nr:sugar phosphate isomerase/epimerase [Ignavibacteriales bacterium]
MKLGFLTSCLPDVSFGELLRWTRGTRFAAVEVAAWPKTSDRKYKGQHLNVDSFNTSDAHRVKDLLGEMGVSISALAYYDNILDSQSAARNGVRAHLKKVIDAASLLNVQLVGTFVGANPLLTPAETFREIVKEFEGILSYAIERGVKIMIENCPMNGWQRPNTPGNLAYSPELWEALFNELQSRDFGLNFDPSHLYWLGIDYEKAAREFGERIFHVHAKDCELLPEGLYRYGIYGPQLTSDARDPGWWRYRLPGNGSLDWRRFIGVLREVGYDGVLSLELEDPDWEGSEEKTKAALVQGAEFLSGLIKAS